MNMASIGDHEIVYNLKLTNTASGSYDINTTWYPTYPGNTWIWPTYIYSWPTTVYKYQVQCPKESCKAYNWLELDTITPCIKCGAKLKAVLDQADFEIPVNA